LCHLPFPALHNLGGPDEVVRVIPGFNMQPTSRKCRASGSIMRI
jgi:hypothetical protein